MKTRQQSRGGAVGGQENGVAGDGVSAASRNLKRAAVEHGGKSTKAPKRGFGDITNAISSSLVIDSGKKKLGVLKKKGSQIPQPRKTQNGRRTRSSNSSKALPPLPEASSEGEDMELAETMEGRESSSNSSTDSATSTQSSPAVATGRLAEEDPCPEFDYDLELGVDIFNLTEYARGVFVYLRSREAQFYVGNYLSSPRQVITANMRMILVDWMVEVQENFELNHETLYLAVKLTDLYIARSATPVPKDDLQLAGSTALFIASKYEEKMAPCSDDFLYICDDAYSREQLLAMERKMLSVIGFDIGSPLSYRFLRRFAKVSKVNMELLTLARYVLESSLLHYEFCDKSESLLAAAAFLLALRILNHGDWSAVQEKYSGLKLEEVEPMMWKLNSMISKGPPENVTTVFEKYSHEVFYSVAKNTPLEPPQQSPTFSRMHPG